MSQTTDCVRGTRGDRQHLAWCQSIRCRLPAMAFAAGFTLSGMAVAAPGNVVRLGTADAPATFVEDKTGASYQIFVEARESNNGAGDTTIGVWGSNLRACSIHGPGVEVFSGSAFAYSSNSPFVAIQCGTAYGQSVTIVGCSTAVEAHGFLHTDHPNSNYLGEATITLQFSQDKKGNRMDLFLDGTKLSGSVTAGSIFMPNCP